ncbi:hypothetical protein E4U46_003071 [Claviceps purpurea]|nr:hypothetical protein E4U28_003209 [Claviceps purpurea]KAG6200867.1 hypothetical protein E4U10_001293 [Claviceps purpurea]KAG6212927.1 hypothetical protein E4U50_001735 [Claviceps purpurea]KAG6288718.1 hypothetical protein E4U46_003071 [Claviceps purpurea]
MPLSCNLPPIQSGQMSGAEEPANKIWTGFATIFGGSNVEYRPSQVKRGRLGRSDRGRARPTASTADGKEKSTSTQGLAAVLVSISQVGPRPWPGQTRHSHFGPASVIVLALDIELACGSAILHSLHCSSAVQVQSKSPSRSRREWRFVARPAAPATAHTPSSLSRVSPASCQFPSDQVATANCPGHPGTSPAGYCM